MSLSFDDLKQKNNILDLNLVFKMVDQIKTDQGNILTFI